MTPVNKIANIFKYASKNHYMSISTWFIKLMKDEPTKTKKIWLIDESKCLTLAEVKQLRQITQKLKLQGIKQNRFSIIRNWFMVELGLNAGLRVSEMTNLKIKDLKIHNDRSSIVVLGKGNKKRSVWISSSFKNTIKHYLKHVNSDYVLPNINGQKISKRALQKFFKQIMKKANLEENYSIHCLRHTYATFLLQASNYNYRFVQNQLGHASIRTTQIYATVFETVGRKALEQLYKKGN